MKKSDSNTKFKIIIGNWYQRTTLHLTEVHFLFNYGSSNLDLDKKILKNFHKKFNFASVKREAGCLEAVVARTKDDIEIKYYEDGLYVLEIESADVVGAETKLRKYYDEVLSPAISYIFSKGAPTPKILANIKIGYPAGVGIITPKPKKYVIDEKIFGKVYSRIESKDFVVYKTPNYVIVVSTEEFSHVVSELIEMQLFFREFKDQLQKYLNIHRTIWEEISTIKERKFVKGKDVGDFRNKLDSYQTSINLIKSRINQMGIYINTRASLSKRLGIENSLTELFEYKFEVLFDTLAYIKEIWSMTSDYLLSAIQNIVEIKSQSTANGVNSLRWITSISVLSSIIGYLSIKNVPDITMRGVWYFVAILTITIILNSLVGISYRNKNYKIKFGNRKEDL